MALTSSGQVRYTLKTPYRDGTSHIVLDPLDLMARLAALVPPPRMHLTRFHGVFTPHSKLRAAVTPAHRGMGAPKLQVPAAETDKPATPRHVTMNWARRLKRVFGVEIESCTRCGGRLRIIASIQEPQIIAKILSHLEKTAPDQGGGFRNGQGAGQGFGVRDRAGEGIRGRDLPAAAGRRYAGSEHKARSAHKQRL